jgi:ArsR family transcriptional regulator
MMAQRIIRQSHIKDKRSYELRARIVKALSHPTRLEMVDALSEGEKCVCELQSLVGYDMSTVSKHLAVLKEAGIVEVDKRGQQVFYRLRVPCILEFFGCIEAVLSERTREILEASHP